MLAWTSRVAAEAAPAAAIIVVVGGDAVVGHALQLLLRGSGYDARVEALSTFGAGGAPLDAGLILLAPGLDEWDRGAVLAYVDAVHRGGGLPVVELVPAATSVPRDGHVLLPWPCRTEDLEREIGAALEGARGRVGRSAADQEGSRIAYDRDLRPRR